MMLQGMIFFLAIPLMVGNDFSWTTIGDNVIFNNFNMEVFGGEKVQLKGKNGSGKSTLIKIILGKESQIRLHYSHLGLFAKLFCFFDTTKVEKNSLPSKFI